MEKRIPVYADIITAHHHVKNFVHRTPVLTSSQVNRLTGSKIWFKCENFQKTGAFKFRGASNAVNNLTSQEAEKGVATHSSGNHAAALALAAATRDIAAYIVMPSSAPEVKVAAVKSYGADITFCEPTLEAREKTLEKILAKTGANFIHPYNNFDIIAGQGTAAKEFLEDQGELDVVIAPVGGGGLLSGTAISVKSFNPAIRVIGAEPAGADDAYQSFISGRLIPSVNPKTIADGLLTSLGDITFSIIQSNVNEIITVQEETIVKAMRLIWERMKIIIEPSAAVSLAVVLENQKKFAGKNTGIILSGGNVDFTKLPF
ncbi:MAG: pyridoxal-phosphate dependent enzyme [Bacteroidales bacterium]